MQEIGIILTSPDALLPKRATTEAIGYDLFTPQSETLFPWSRILIDTNVRVKIPIGHYLRIAPKSSLARIGVDVAAGVVDRDYEGNLIVCLVNNSSEQHVFLKQSSIAQFILEKASIVPIKLMLDPPLKQRGAEGFGSTGGVKLQTLARIIPTAPLEPQMYPPLPRRTVPSKVGKRMPAQVRNIKESDKETKGKDNRRGLKHFFSRKGTLEELDPLVQSDKLDPHLLAEISELIESLNIMKPKDPKSKEMANKIAHLLLENE